MVRVNLPRHPRNTSMLRLRLEQPSKIGERILSLSLRLRLGLLLRLELLRLCLYLLRLQANTEARSGSSIGTTHACIRRRASVRVGEELIG